MEDFEIILPLLTLGSVLLSNFITFKAVKNLSTTASIEYAALEREQSKRRLIILPVVFIPLFLKKYIEKIEDPLFLCVGVLVFGWGLMFYFSFDWLKKLKANQFPEEFIKKYKLSQAIKI
jgi:undecaprenyl pyrophosphate phosphatase UppP